jgi:hypothetical protein
MSSAINRGHEYAFAARSVWHQDSSFTLQGGKPTPALKRSHGAAALWIMGAQKGKAGSGRGITVQRLVAAYVVSGSNHKHPKTQNPAP